MLFVTGITEPVPVEVRVNDVAVKQGRITTNGGQQFVAETCLEQGPAKIAFVIPNAFKGHIRIDNVRVVWIEDNSSLAPAWVAKDNAPNEIWNYNDPESDRMYEQIANGPASKFIALDYLTDGTTPSYLKNYAYVETNGKTIKLRDIENKGPYAFVGPGSFVIPMASPVAYWLMERLFVAL